MKIKLLLLTSFLFLSAFAHAQVIKYNDNLFNQGLSVSKQNSSGVTLTYSISQFDMEDVNVNGSLLKSVHLPGVFLPNDEGAPDLPGFGRYIAIPQGAKVSFKITSQRTERIQNVEIAPAPRIPKDTEKGPLEYKKNNSIYSTNSYYPQSPVLLSEMTKIRGVDAVIAGITPFQYNPVTKELIIYKDLEIDISFTGGNGIYGEERFRSRWWEPILQDIFINYSALPKVNFNNKNLSKNTNEYEYIIITPDNPQFIPWADSLKNFRLQQGINAGVVTLTQIGGNTTAQIESYINNAYNTWSVPPTAVLLLGDYSTGAANGSGVNSPVYNSYCVSDHLYADVNGDHMADIVFARISANNSSQLSTIVNKILKYERQPPTNPVFYDKPITAMGWQTERWFQLCSEVVNGFWANTLGKHPVRENAIYQGTPGASWSSATNTSTVVSYFGPSGRGYIPSTASHLTDWSGSAAKINNDINQGAFMLQHRDHGAENGWGEPAYTSSNIASLNNNDLSFIMSINCLTGKFNYSSDCFAEVFHRHPKGALGLIAATEVSYSFVNDAYVWGMMDNMWPSFMNDYGRVGQVKILPAFGNVAGKFFLKQSNWPYNTSNKEVTYYLFHHHGDAFLSVYSEMPQNLTVTHNPVITSGETSFTVTADEGALIGITVNGELLADADATGGPVTLTIPPQMPGNNILVTITKQNYYRYSKEVQVIPPAGAYIIHEACTISDSLSDNPGNGNGLLDYGESAWLNICAKNVGIENASNVTLTLRSTDTLVVINDSTEFYGTIPAGSSVSKNHGFQINVKNSVPDNHIIPFVIIASNGSQSWISNFGIKAHAPVLQYVSYAIIDSTGNLNGRVDPGETVDLLVSVKNAGSSKSYDVSGQIFTNNTFITINNGIQSFGIIDTNSTVIKRFKVTADISTPAGNQAVFDLLLAGNYGISASGTFNFIIGQVPVMVIDLDPNSSSAPKILQSIQNNNVAVQTASALPTTLNLYTSLFVSLGIFSSNHKLTAAEGQQLADYLNSGGKLYMEGGDTWYYDTKTAVHPMFNIQGVADGSGNLVTIQGQTGSICQGLNSTYTGENNYIDQINPIAPAVAIFKNSSPVYGCAVSYSATNYKTIGSSFEFGGISNAAIRDSIMGRYLDFFNLRTVPVELISFTAVSEKEGVVLNWETATELNNNGFDIERSSNGTDFLKIGFVAGNGNSTKNIHYTFSDKTLKGSGKVYYRLRQKDTDGSNSASKTIEVEYSVIPVEFSLSQNYPNPFNPVTTIKFAIPNKSEVVLKVYDVIGKEVEVLINNPLEPGYYSVNWNASKYSSGVYFYRIQAGEFTMVKKLILMK